MRLLDFFRDAGKIAIVSHGDADGVCSGAISAMALDPSEVSWFYTEEPYITKELALKLEKFDRILVVDVPIVKNISGLEKKTLWIDHHPVHDIPLGLKYINPRKEDPSAYVPVSLLAYELFSPFIKKDVLWMALTGVVLDWGIGSNREFVQKARARYNLKEKTQEEFNKTDYAKLGEIIDFCIKQEKAGYIFNLLLEKDFKEVLQDKTLNRIYDEEKSRIRKIINEHKKKARLYKDSKVLGYFIGGYKSNSIIARDLKEMYPGWVVIVAKYDKKDRTKVTMSLRQSGRDGNLAELGLKALEDLDYENFGGHRNACGGKMALKDFEKFVENLAGISGI